MARHWAFGNLLWGRGRLQTSAELHDAWPMAGGLDEAKEVGCRDPCGRGVLERMTIDLGEVHEGLMDHHGDVSRGVVQQGERRHRAGRYAEHAFEQLRLAEAETAASEPLRKLLDVNACVVLGDHEDQVSVLVGEEQALCVRARDRGAQARRLLDGEHGLVLNRGHFDAELFQVGEQGVSVDGHRCSAGWVALIRGAGAPSYQQWPVVDTAEAINYKPAAIESADGRRLRR